MKLKHFHGYGSLDVTKVKDTSCTLHIRVKGNHECGLRRDDLYDLYVWLVKRFDKTIPDSGAWRKMNPTVTIIESIENGIDVCDYKFTYSK